jgi:hypothetical protein
VDDERIDTQETLRSLHERLAKIDGRPETVEHVVSELAVVVFRLIEVVTQLDSDVNQDTSVEIGY